MKLVITQSNLTLKGGAERILLKIAQHYKAKIYTGEYDKNSTFPEFKDLDVEVIGKQNLQKFLPYGRAIQGLNYGLSFLFFKIKEDYDVLNPHIAPAHWVRNMNPRVLWYCHTPLREVWDLYHYRMKLKAPHVKAVHAIGATAIRAIDKAVVEKIEYIFANSENSRARIEKYFQRDAAVLGGGIEYKRYKNSGDEKFFFYPSRISPNKQQIFAVNAFEIFRSKMGKAGEKYKLILSGPVSRDRAFVDYYEKVASRARRVEGVKIITNASDDSLLKMYSKCTSVLYTPVNEDYGLVPLEGMASGKPVIAINEGGPRETIVRDKTGFLINTAEQMADKMKYVAEHPAIATKIGKEGVKRIRTHYTWDRFFEAFDKKAREVAKS